MVVWVRERESSVIFIFFKYSAQKSPAALKSKTLKLSIKKNQSHPKSYFALFGALLSGSDQRQSDCICGGDAAMLANESLHTKHIHAQTTQKVKIRQHS